MVGLGERLPEITTVFSDLVSVGCELVTVGQYLRPTPAHLPVERFYAPSEYPALAERGPRARARPRGGRSARAVVVRGRSRRRTRSGRGLAARARGAGARASRGAVVTTPGTRVGALKSSPRTPIPGVPVAMAAAGAPAETRQDKDTRDARLPHQEDRPAERTDDRDHLPDRSGRGGRPRRPRPRRRCPSRRPARCTTARGAAATWSIRWPGRRPATASGRSSAAARTANGTTRTHSSRPRSSRSTTRSRSAWRSC